jgi:inner membrane protein involved in colicin E2 resistance
VLAADVLLEGNSLLLEGFSVDITNVTLVLLIPLEVIGNVSQTREGVEHDTRNDVAEHYTEEDSVYSVITEPHNLEGLHRLSNRP